MIDTSLNAYTCPDHRPSQHRDGKVPWCNLCGYTAPVPAKPAIPAVHKDQLQSKVTINFHLDDPRYLQ